MNNFHKKRFSGQPLNHSLYQGILGLENGHFYSIPSEICDKIDTIHEKYGELYKIPDTEKVDVYLVLSNPTDPYVISKYPVRIQVNHIKCQHGYLVPNNTTI